MRIALAPFPGRPAPAVVSVEAEIVREGPLLRLRWILDDPDEVVALAEPAAEPARRFALWDATCFEAFVRTPGDPGYWELNLAPSGDWNLYRLDGYRTGLREEPAVQALGPAEVVLDAGLLGIGDRPWELAVTAVIQERSGNMSFWATHHPGSEPDFHHPDAFRIAL